MKGIMRQERLDRIVQKAYDSLTLHRIVDEHDRVLYETHDGAACDDLWLLAVERGQNVHRVVKHGTYGYSVRSTP